jgi:hypothetical protein
MIPSENLHNGLTHVNVLKLLGDTRLQGAG